VSGKVSRHAIERVAERCKDAGMDPVKVVAKAVVAARAAKPGESVAVRIATFPKQVNETWGDRSNGDTIWAVIRNQEVMTFMLRRSTQPATAAAMRVDRVQFAE